MSRRPVPPLLPLLLFSLALPAARPLWGAEVRVEIHHVQHQILATKAEGCEAPAGCLLGESTTIKARKDSKVLISIVDPNPLLFDYTLQKGDATPTENAKALGTFTTSLSDLVSSLDGNLKAATAATQSMAKKPQLFAQSAAATGKPAEQAPPFECFSAVAGLKRVADDLNKWTDKRVAITNLSLTDHTGAKAGVAEWQLDDSSKQLQKADDDLSVLAGKLLANPGEPDLDQCRSVIALARTTLPTLRKALTDLKDFKSLVDQIDVPKTLVFTVDVNVDQAIKLSIKASDNFPTNLNKAQLFTGDTSFTVSPVSHVAITAGAAAIYSFVRSPTFSAVSSGGQFVITQTKNDYNKLDGAVMMQIEPDAWNLDPLSVGVQIGVSPKTDLGLYLGLSLRATGFFTLGAGVAFQRVDQLAPGLSVGQTIATQDLLKTEKTFRSGLYLHMTVTTQKRSQ